VITGDDSLTVALLLQKRGGNHSSIENSVHEDRLKERAAAFIVEAFHAQGKNVQKIGGFVFVGEEKRTE
jgi:hypothetical protein